MHKLAKRGASGKRPGDLSSDAEESSYYSDATSELGTPLRRQKHSRSAKSKHSPRIGSFDGLSLTTGGKTVKTNSSGYVVLDRVNNDDTAIEDPDKRRKSADATAALLPIAHGASIMEPMVILDDPSAPLELSGGSSSVFSAVMNFVNSIVGAGVVGLPYAVMQSGLWMGIFLLAAIAFVVDWSVRLLITTSKLASRNTYQDMVEYTFGRRGLIAISLFQFSFAFGAMCAYTVIVGDTLSPVLKRMVDEDASDFVQTLVSRRFIITVATVGIMFPLSLYRDISKLAKTSAFAIFALFFIWFVMLVVGPSESGERRGDVSWDFINSGFLQAIGVISFAFVCHHNTFIIFSSLTLPTLDRWAKVAHLSVALSLFLSMGMALSGYFVFGSMTQANILNNFSDNNGLVATARVMFAMNMFTTFPLEAFVCREVIANLMYPGTAHLPTKLHVAITTALTGVSLLIALSTCNLGVVLELTGCFSATALAYIFPPAMYLKLAGGPVLSMKKIGPLLCLVFGVILMFTSTITTLQAALNETEEVRCDW